MRILPAAVVALAVSTACGRHPSAPVAVHRLVDEFKPEMVQGRPSESKPPDPAGFWNFKEASSKPVPKEAPETLGWKIGANVSNLAIRDGRLSGRSTSSFPVIYVDRMPGADESDVVQALEIHMRVDKGTNLSVTSPEETKLDFKQIENMGRVFPWMATTPIVAGTDFQTYVVRNPISMKLSKVQYLLIRPTDADQANFEIESIRVISRKEFLDRIASGVGWQGLSEIYRETVVARAPESIRWELQVPESPVLDLHVGTIEYEPVTFRLTLAPASDPSEATVLAERTVTTSERWEPLTANLAAHAGRRVVLSLSLAAGNPGALGFWGSPSVRNGGMGALAAKRTKPAVELAAGDPPQGVILLIADTLRKDHLQLYGYNRETAPVLARMASQGALFRDNTSQATWTKVSMPSILTSLYPTSHRIADFTDRLSPEATTLAEVFREAGYATLSLSSVLFSGRFSNLHQGFEELHEAGSVRDGRFSKTAREYVDRLSEWLENHANVPFFVFLHVFDPHDPYEPYRPYNSMWADSAHNEEHQRNLEKVRKFIADPLMKRFGMPNRDELVAAGLDPMEYVSRDIDWYDGSIRAMDVEIGRLHERLKSLGLADKTLIVFASDHGEEFLEHGRMFHGQSVHGELTGVPLVFYRPGQIPAGAVIDETVENIDIMPTILELSHLPLPKGMQGKSLLPLLAAARDRAKAAAAPVDLGELASKYGWRSRPAVTEKASTKQVGGPPPRNTESYSLIYEGWRLVHNIQRPEGVPEFELYDHKHDPLTLSNVASQHPDKVKELNDKLESWHKSAISGQLPKGNSTKGMSKEELERLRALGYIQ